ncbi:hypothetical protein C4J81_02420 [Deltaproteobacteria bacterium Smac51]|nr:hypothetical protein C4J81_02420 [Deltaproteobacteria bacterium Smac51]
MQVTLKRPARSDETYSAHQGQTILSFLASNGIHIDAPCAGRGKCGKCRVKASGELSPPEEKELNILGPVDGERLACQARINGPVVIELAEAAQFSSVRGLGESEPYTVDSPLKFKRLAPAGRQDATDLMTLGGIEKATIAALNELADIDADRKAALAVMWGEELLKATPIDEGEGDLLAAAVDLGTTGLAVAIIDMLKGEVVAQGTSLNPQTTCGGDVISRITVASEGPDELARLQSLALGGISSLVRDTAGKRAPRIMAMSVSANTTMTYLLAGVQPKGLAQSPYRPVFIKSLDLSHLADKLNIGANAKVFTSPCISAYVGGDITSGMLAVGLKKLPGTVLYIDIGTNGEIVLSHQGRLVSTSCAAGPALEGMNIIRGQRATPGAVDSFEISPDYQYKFTTIAEAPAIGICGSGLIDLTAALVTNGLVDKTGRMKPPQDIPAGAEWLNGLKDGRFQFADDVFFDQKDVRQVQLAKGAIAAAVEMLLARVGLNENDLDEIIIAGAFGFHLKAESLKSISLIPPSYQGPVRFVGNSSLAGAARMLLTPSAIEELNALAAETEVIELGFDPQFQNIFVKHLKF